jgi:hypothetical protein
MARTLAARRLQRAIATFGDWDEPRHVRQFGECLNRGGISIIQVDGARVGTIQFFDLPDAVEVREIQIQPSRQPGD